MYSSKPLLALSTALIILVTLSITLQFNNKTYQTNNEVAILAPLQHRILQQQNNDGTKSNSNNKNKRLLRVAALGGSVTWGATLSNKRQAYPHVLGSLPGFVVRNFAIRATGSDYPSHCVESMLGAKLTYDVILLEFTLNGTEGLLLLLQRLRRRFPEAIIIYIDLYSLKHEAFDLTSKETPEQTDFDPSRNWIWNPNKVKHDDFNNYLQKQMKLIHGHVLVLPRAYPAYNSLSMFSEDWHHLSPHGHRVLAEEIEKRLNTLPKPPVNPKVGSWGEGDQCETWFTTGETTLNYKGAFLRSFADYKFSMEIGYKTGVVVVHNNKSHRLPLFISYMARYAVYPITQVRIDGRMFTLDTHITLPDHIMKTVEVGYVEPGKNVITFTPLKGPTTLPFRLTAIIMCGVCHGFQKDKVVGPH